jgi:hypothetical protein
MANRSERFWATEKSLREKMSEPKRASAFLVEAKSSHRAGSRV